RIPRVSLSRFASDITAKDVRQYVDAALSYDQEHRDAALGVLEPWAYLRAAHPDDRRFATPFAFGLSQLERLLRVLHSLPADAASRDGLLVVGVEDDAAAGELMQQLGCRALIRTLADVVAQPAAT